MMIPHNNGRLNPNAVHVLEMVLRLAGKDSCKADAECDIAGVRKLGSELWHGVWETMMVDVDTPEAFEGHRPLCFAR